MDDDEELPNDAVFTLPRQAVSYWMYPVEAARQLEQEVERLRARCVALEAAARECADELEAEIRERYADALHYPCMRADYERDMAPVAQLRALLGKTEL